MSESVTFQVGVTVSDLVAALTEREIREEMEECEIELVQDDHPLAPRHYVARSSRTSDDKGRRILGFGETMLAARVALAHALAREWGLPPEDITPSAA